MSAGTHPQPHRETARFRDQTVVVTGSSRNIGKAIAEAFAREGANVVLNARTSADELETTASEFRSQGFRVLPVLADLGDPAAVRNLVKQATDEFGKIDVLVINHSVRPVRPLLEITDEEWSEVVALNLDSAFYLCRAVVPGMIERGGGTVVAIGGGGGPAPPVGKAHAVATLTARGALLRGLMREVASAGIRVNWVAPGIIDTVRKHPDWYPEAPDGRVQDLPEVIRQIPLGRPGLPHEIADAVLFVASQEAAYMTGATLNVSGGWGL